MVHLHRGKGVPLKGPFLGCFSQGNLTEMNEMRGFRGFRMFWDCNLPHLGGGGLLS